MRYTVKALAAVSGQVEEILVDADDEPGARRIADGRGLTVLSVKRAAGSLLAGGKAARFPLQLFSQELLALLQSGLPVVEALQTLAEKETRTPVRAMLDALLRGLSEGRTLSTVMAAHPGSFPDLYVSMLRAAERTSDLDHALARYIAYRTQVDTLRGKIVSASIYPLMLLGVGGLVVLFLLGYVVPRFAGVFEEAGGELPLASRLLIDFGSFVSAHGGVAALGLLGAVAAIVAVVRHPAVRAAAARLAWRVPAVGDRIKVFQLARFYRTLSMLVSGGLTVLVAMQMARDLLSAALRDKLDTAMREVREGRALSDALASNGLTTPVASRMLRVGERAGRLGEMAERTAAFHEEEIARWVEWITRFIGPLLMLVIGVVIGLIVVLMYMPIFQLAETLQ